MKKLCSQGITEECAFLQTCNRVEIYGVSTKERGEDSVEDILKFWSANTGISLDILTRNVEVLKGEEAVVNLFNVASGIDSMAIGEDQILGQVKTSYAKAKELGTVHNVLDNVFSRAINVGKKVRNKTRVNQGSTSISSAAVDLAAKQLGGLTDKTALVVGAGEAGSVAAETLRRRNINSIIIANRTLSTGLQLAKKVSGQVVTLEDIYDVFPKVDLAIIALSVDRPEVNTERLRNAYHEQGKIRDLLIIDISQPRAVHSSVETINGVTLKNIDDLEQVLKQNKKTRQIEASKAKNIILEELDRFRKQQSESLVEPLISQIFKRAEEIRQKELKRALNKMTLQEQKEMAVIDRFSKELVERILQTPIDQLRQSALKNEGTLLLAFEKLFNIRR
jgi:glutamyl-tRNA reductase